MKTLLQTFAPALVALGILSSSSPANAFNFQYVREVSIDMCGWADRPITSTCVLVDASGSNAIACGAPSQPPPTTHPTFNLTASEPCPLDPYNGCPRQRWKWSDERMLSGFRSNEIRCPTNPAEWGTGIYTLPLMTSRSGHVFMQVPAFFAHQTAKKVRAQVKLRAYSLRPWEPWNLPYRPMTAILALQQLNALNQWVDIATQVVYDDPLHTTTYYVYEAEAMVLPFSMVRLELRAGSVPAPVSTNDFEYYKNYHLELDIMEGRLILPECIVDQSTGTCF
ncbi:hypothetical protein D7Y13_00255 [Corallococcus praedator]|uniref:Uncharacterized protein n=1 Tax=Corallococcus praedator TaxID=2316724 RepID=A0ABX9QTU5_9BACT|nr:MULTISPECIES: hypothetical protein [Corallococcus]RKH21793.1 hypothetical protein D7X74_00225 [Corallococcus sp. CA047B]RKH36534.1 hypothetical protein D7X75_00485 [Corallococcus sp. CA031C]RKI17754.1 hypothetical protein D7Y13_00255 [Corallococcus praedator]